MIDFFALPSLLKPYAVNDDSLMPWAYQKANPNGRPLHNDWILFKGTPRMKTAYRIPLPMKITSGKAGQAWIMYDGKYPLAPTTQIKKDDLVYLNTAGQPTHMQIPYVLADQPPDTGFCTYAAWLGGRWVECFQQYQRPLFGKRFQSYIGLRQDTTISVQPDGTIRSDWMAWFPEASCSWTTGG